MISPKFLKGGKAFFTVSNDKGEHFTFKIAHHEKTGRYYANVLKGPDNYRNYEDLALFHPIQGYVTPNAYAKLGASSKEYKVLEWAVRAVHAGASLPAGYDIQHAGKCCVCARKLTTPESISAGIGPTCAANQGGF